MPHSRSNKTKDTLLPLCITDGTRVYVMVNDVAKHETDSMEGVFCATYITSVPRQHHGLVKFCTFRSVDVFRPLAASGLLARQLTNFP